MDDLSVEGEGTVPQWVLKDRLVKARDVAGITAAEMADYLGLSRAAVSDFENGRRTPRRAYLRAWAAYCGVSYIWLTESKSPADAWTTRTPVGSAAA